MGRLSGPGLLAPLTAGLVPLWRRRFRRYALHQTDEWPAGRERQVRKLEAGLARIDARPRRAVRQLLRTAAERSCEGVPAIFVVNCGSSGSHWLTTMMADVPGLADCGEVYAPRDVLVELEGWSSQVARRSFLDCLHLAHHPTGALDASEILINSAHLSGWRLARLYGPLAKVVLLIRDPLDVVLSRTWRKNELRTEVAPEDSDAEYLKRSVDFVTRFYDAAREVRADVVVSYEEMRSDTASVLRQVLHVTEAGVSSDVLDQAAARHQVGSSTTNVYKGPRIAPPEHLRGLAEDSLSRVRSEWGYV